MENYAKYFHWTWPATVNLSESTTNLIDTVKIILFWVLSKLASPYRSKSVKAVLKNFEIKFWNVDINHSKII